MAKQYTCSGWDPVKGYYHEFYDDNTNRTIRVYDSGEVEVTS